MHLTMRYLQAMTNYEKLLSSIEKIAIEQFGNPTKMADSLDFPQSTVSKMLNKKSCPRIDTVCELLDKLNAQILFPDEHQTEPQGCITPEAKAIDTLITAMRSGGAVDAAIRDAVLRQIESMFEKKENPKESEERRFAS
ncbi:MAG: hypothetical protein JEY79_14110 [Pseudodesulfovibrio sp.]|nr:hypothetical protein [Pseudodesulfovibrio sp.]